MMISQMNQSQLLHWIDMVSFAVVEITEYLDTHPDDEEALKYCNYALELEPENCDANGLKQLIKYKIAQK